MQSSLPPTLPQWPLDHVAIAVTDLVSASRPYLLMGMTLIEEEFVPDQGVTVRMLATGGQRIEFLQPATAESPVGRFLARRGPGLHHIALRVPSLAAEVDRLRAEGARFTSEEPRQGSGGSRIIFLHPSWTGGVLIELVERPASHG